MTLEKAENENATIQCSNKVKVKQMPMKFNSIANASNLLEYLKTVSKVAPIVMSRRNSITFE